MPLFPNFGMLMLKYLPLLFRSSYWRPAQAAVKPNFHLPMRSFELKNRLV